MRAYMLTARAHSSPDPATREPHAQLHARAMPTPSPTPTRADVAMLAADAQGARPRGVCGRHHQLAPLPQSSPRPNPNQT